MKKLISIFIFTLMLITVSFYAQLKQWIRPISTVDKNIVLTISPDNSYRHKVYDHSSAQLNVTVIKLSRFRRDTLVTKEYPEFKLKNLTAVSERFNETIHIPDAGSGPIVINYNITYKWKGSILEIKNLKRMDKGMAQDQLLIHI